MTDNKPQKRELRIQTLQLLCQFDAGNEDVALITDEYFDEESSSTNEPCDEATVLAKKIWDDRTTGDAQIESFTPEWPLYRQPLLDRNILRLARYEIVSEMTPPIVAIDEAVELGRIFSTEKSSTFINGVLDSLLHSTKRDS
jgi:N utilization substance protein B